MRRCIQSSMEGRRVSHKPVSWGYVRVSSKDQNVARQIIAMHEKGIADDHIIIDKASGKDFDREGWQRLNQLMRSGDSLVVVSLDRLGRTHDEVTELMADLRKRNIQVVILDMAFLNAREGMTREEKWMRSSVISLLAFVAEGERIKIKERQKEGIRAARMRGVVFGRPPYPDPDGYEEIMQKYLDDEITGLDAARLLGMNTHTFYRRARILVKRLREKKGKGCMDRG